MERQNRGGKRRRDCYQDATPCTYRVRLRKTVTSKDNEVNAPKFSIRYRRNKPSFSKGQYIIIRGGGIKMQVVKFGAKTTYVLVINIYITPDGGGLWSFFECGGREREALSLERLRLRNRDTREGPGQWCERAKLPWDEGMSTLNDTKE